MAYSERELLARIIQCEAGGEGDNGMKAVATVVLNRVNASEGEYLRVSQGGILQDVGASFIILRSIENDSLVYCDIYAIKFITISTTSMRYY